MRIGGATTLNRGERHKGILTTERMDLHGRGESETDRVYANNWTKDAGLEQKGTKGTKYQSRGSSRGYARHRKVGIAEGLKLVGIERCRFWVTSEEPRRLEKRGSFASLSGGRAKGRFF
jgi:hypothetical protein